MRLAKRNCANNCGRLAENGPRCSSCQKQHDASRPSRTDRGYDRYHSKLRVLCFIRDGWKCVDCGWEPDVIREARAYEIDQPPPSVILAELRERWHNNQRHLHGDHDIPIQDRPDLRLDLDNYKTRCNECHSAKTIREQNGGKMKAIVLLAALFLVALAPLQAAEILGGQATPHTDVLTWTASTTPGTTVNVYRAAGSCASNPTSFTPIATGVAAGGPYTDASPLVGTQCYYVTAALNGVESAPSNKVSVTSLVSLPAPTALAATAN